MEDDICELQRFFEQKEQREMDLALLEGEFEDARREMRELEDNELNRVQMDLGERLDFEPPSEGYEWSMPDHESDS